MYDNVTLSKRYIRIKHCYSVGYKKNVTYVTFWSQKNIDERLIAMASYIGGADAHQHTMKRGCSRGEHPLLLCRDTRARTGDLCNVTAAL